ARDRLVRLQEELGLRAAAAALRVPPGEGHPRARGESAEPQVPSVHQLVAGDASRPCQPYRPAYRPGAGVVKAARMEHLLFLAHRIPYPPTKGDKVRSYNLLRYLATRYRVHLGAFVDDDADLAHTGALRELCEGCHLPRLDTRIARMRSLTGLASGAPLTLPYYASASMGRWVAEVLRTQAVRKVVVFSSGMAQYVPPMKELRCVVDLVDVDSDKWWQYAARQPWPWSAIYRRESRTLLRYEREIAGRFDATVLVSSAEADLFRRLAP